MTHWEHRPEPAWQKFEFNQPYAKGLKRLKEDVLAKTDFDPATLWQWGTMQAMAVIEVLKSCERLFGRAGQQAVYEGLHRVGLDVGRQILAGTKKPDDMSEAEFLSFYASVINRIAYASLEAPKIDGPDQVSFDILWCPHQDHYQAFDCRVQRYFVEGMIDAMREFGREHDFDVRFDSTIPAVRRRAILRCGATTTRPARPPGRITRQPSTKKRSRSPSGQRRKSKRYPSISERGISVRDANSKMRVARSLSFQGRRGRSCYSTATGRRLREAICPVSRAMVTV